jgi:hypothetical protein
MAIEVSEISLTFTNISDIMVFMSMYRDEFITGFDPKYEDKVNAAREERIARWQQERKDRKPSSRTRLVVFAASVLTAAAILGGDELTRSSERPQTIYTQPGDTASRTAERALMHQGEYSPSTAQINKALEILAAENPDHAHGSDGALTFDAEVNLLNNEDLTPQN